MPAERRRHARDAALRLTDIERSVLIGLVRGFTEQHIAADLGRTERTVRRIITRLEVKFRASNRAELAAKATQHGFVA